MALSRKQLEARLSPKQMKAALMLVEHQLSDDPDVLSMTQDDIADKLDISRMTLYRWRQNPDFIAYSSLISQTFLGSFEAEVFGILMKGIRTHGDTRRIELFSKIRGLIGQSIVIDLDANKERTEAELENEIKAIEDLINEDDTASDKEE